MLTLNRRASILPDLAGLLVLIFVCYAVFCAIAPVLAKLQAALQ